MNHYKSITSDVLIKALLCLAFAEIFMIQAAINYEQTTTSSLSLTLGGNSFSLSSPNFGSRSDTNGIS